MRKPNVHETYWPRMCKVTGGYLNLVSCAEHTGHLMPAPNGPCDIVVLDFLTLTLIVTAVSQ